MQHINAHTTAWALASFFSLAMQQAQAQACTPLVNIPESEIFLPRPWQEFEPGSGIQDTACTGVPFSTVLNLRPVTTVQNIPVSSMSMATTGAFQNLPAGMTYACNPPNCVFPTGTNACITIYGTAQPGAEGAHDLHFPMIIATALGPISLMFPEDWIANSYYFLYVRPATDPACASQLYVEAKVHALLEGAWSSSTGLMRDNLRTLGYLPLAQPFATAPFNYMGAESIEAWQVGIAGSNAIVDWVLLELRTSPAGSVVARRAALLRRNGDITNEDENALVRFYGVAPGNYYVSVRHRNHLGVMSAAPIALSTSPPLALDLRLATTPTYGLNAQKTITGTYQRALWAGDVNRDGQLKYTGSANDRDPILLGVGSTTPNNVGTGYGNADVTLDGQVKYTGTGNDRDPLLINVGSTTPNNVRLQQLP